MKLKLSTVEELDRALTFLEVERRRRVRLSLRIGPVSEQVVTGVPVRTPRPAARFRSFSLYSEVFGMLLLTATQQCRLTVAPTDKRGNPAPVEGVTWTTSDESVLTVEQDSSDPLSAIVKAVGPIGTAQVNVSADARIGDEVANVSGVLDVEVKAGEAVALAVNTGTPEEQA